MASITHRSFVSYIDRTREFYGAQGYEKPYAWSRNTDAPFAALAKPLAESRVALITTASPWREDKPAFDSDKHLPKHEGVLRGEKEVWSGDASVTPERLYTDDLAWDKESTHTDDVDSFLPLTHVRAAAEAGRIGSVAPRFHGVPTDYSQRRTIEQDAPEVLARCREDEVDIALLVPL